MWAQIAAEMSKLQEEPTQQASQTNAGDQPAGKRSGTCINNRGTSDTLRTGVCAFLNAPPVGGEG